MKRTMMFLLAGLCFFAFNATTVRAGEIDVLMDKLVEKGILTPLEAQIIRDETVNAAAEDLANKKSYAVPSWVQSLKLKGDFRLRYQYERRHNDTEGRERGRVRFRLGAEAKPIDKVKVGFGFATGGTDPRSTNQTFDGSFETGDLRLDYAYAEYQMNKNLKMAGGIFKRKSYLWCPTDLLWDGDINPQGGAVNYQGTLAENIDYFLNGGVLVIKHEDQVDSTDPHVIYTQAGLQYKDEKFDSKLAATYYGFDGVQGNTLDASAGSNTKHTIAGSSVLAYDYDAIAIGGEAGVRKLFGGLPYKIDDRIAVFGEYVDNTTIDKNDNGWIAGIKFGHKKVKKPGTWQAKYMFARMEKDAWVDAFPDSDRYGGATDVKSHEVSWKYALKKNVILGLDYYDSQRILSSKNDEKIIQADLVVKF